MDIKRKDAARLIDKIIILAAREIHSPAQPPSKWATDIAMIVEDFGLKMPEECPGEAHGPNGAHIDHCGVCKNYYHGLVGTDTKVK